MARKKNNCAHKCIYVGFASKIGWSWRITTSTLCLAHVGKDYENQHQYINITLLQMSTFKPFYLPGILFIL